CVAPTARQVPTAGARAGRDEQEHRLRHLGDGGRTRVPPRRRAVRGHAPQHPLVRRAGTRAVTALVTGGSGYFGSLLVRRLRERGDVVRVLDLHDATDRPDDVEFVAADIRDRDAVRAAVDGVDVVYHNVAQVPLAKDAHLLRSVNVDGTRRLLDAAADAGVAKLVHTSSSAVF